MCSSWNDEVAGEARGKRGGAMPQGGYGRSWVCKKMKNGFLAGRRFPRLIMSRAGLTPALDIINLGIYVLGVEEQ